MVTLLLCVDRYADKVRPGGNHCAVRNGIRIHADGARFAVRIEYPGAGYGV